MRFCRSHLQNYIRRGAASRSGWPSRDARWFDGVTVREISRSGQLQLSRQWRFIRDSVLEPVRAPVGDDESLLLPRSETIRRPYNSSAGKDGRQYMLKKLMVAFMVVVVTRLDMRAAHCEPAVLRARNETRDKTGHCLNQSPAKYYQLTPASARMLIVRG